MSINGVVLLALGLSMDAFSVSVCKGFSCGRSKGMVALTCGFWFGLFQALMPLVGYAIGGTFARAISGFDHWIAFGLLAAVGGNMIWESDTPSEVQDTQDLSPQKMAVLALATSIDALAVGLSMAIVNQGYILASSGLIGVVTFCMSALGAVLGAGVGGKFQKHAQLMGGIMLIGVGLHILLK